MREINIRDADLAKALDRRTDEALHDLIRDPLAVGLGVRGPYLGCERREDGEEVDWAFAVLERERLPDETTPAEEEKHVSVVGLCVMILLSSTVMDCGDRGFILKGERNGVLIRNEGVRTQFLDSDHPVSSRSLC